MSNTILDNCTILIEYSGYVVGEESVDYGDCTKLHHYFIRPNGERFNPHLRLSSYISPTQEQLIEIIEFDLVDD